MKPPDPGHPYGHRKFEAISAIVISFFMFMTSLQVLSKAVQRLFSPKAELPEVTVTSYIILVATAAINYFVCKYETRKGKELNSALLIADSHHTMSDIYVTLTVLATLIAIQLKFPILDVFASVIIVGMIFKAGYEIIMAHMGSLVDAAILDPLIVEEVVLKVPGVKSCHRIRSRGSQEHMFIDLHVLVSSDLSIEEAHNISYAVEHELKKLGGGVVDVLVHLEDDRHENPD